jgi:hypothetical protein
MGSDGPILDRPGRDEQWAHRRGEDAAYYSTPAVLAEQLYLDRTAVDEM